MPTPDSIAIIMDGNGRWASLHGRRPHVGHTKGHSTAQTVIRAAFNRGVSHVAVWAASKSNFEKRSVEEMRHLARILKVELRHRRRSNEEGRVRVRGNWRAWLDDPDLEVLIQQAETETAKYRARNLWILFGYDSKTDELQARMSMHRDGVEPTDEELDARLCTAGLPQVDLIIRTGVEHELNDSDPFLTRHRQDTVIIPTKTLWPDFTVAELDEMFDRFHHQPRRRGGRIEPSVVIAAE